MKKFPILLLIISHCAFAIMSGKPLFDVTLGDPSYEYKSVKGINSYILADTKQRTVNERKYSEYYNLQDFKAKQRFFRVHIPVIIKPNFSSLPDVVNLSYSFSFESIYRKKVDNKKQINKSVINFPFKWEKIPLLTGVATKWTVSSEWMVKSDKDIWDNSDILVENSFGKLKIVSKESKSDRWAQPLVDLYFPFSISYWSDQKGVDNLWPDEIFPELVYREVKGNEVFLGCSVQVFPPDSDDLSCGTLEIDDLSKLFNNLKKDWINPYKNKNVYTNLWKESSWAAKYEKIADQRLKAAFLSRICHKFPDDSDAAEMLLKQLAINKDSEKAGRIYVKCKKKWPRWAEHWFKIYLSSVKDEPTRRALLMAFRREQPNSGFALYKLTDSLIKDERTGPAKRLAKTWQSIEPSNIYVYAAQVDIAKLNDNEDKLKIAYNQAIRFALPVQTNICLSGPGYNLYVKGCNLLKAGNIEDALRYFRKTLTITNSAACHLRIGDAYLKAGITASAIRSYKKALDLSPKHPAALSGILHSYNKIKDSHSEKPYQKSLENVISPLVKKEILKKNWTNAIALAKYVLDAYPDSYTMSCAYIRSLIHLGLFDQASEKLYKLSGKRRFDAQANMLWAELIMSIYNDKGVLVLSKNKIDWLELAIKAWEKVSELSPAYPVAYLEQAILNLQKQNYSRAYLALKKCYKISPSPELAIWIADICMQKADISPNMTLPDHISKTFAAEAVNFYIKANESADNKFYSPESCIGRYRAAKHESKSGADYNAYLRKASRIFPASPEIRAAQIKAYTDAGATAPALWVPYTNALENLRPVSSQVLSCLVKIYSLREINKSSILMKAALNDLFWSTIFFKNTHSKNEIASPQKIYTIKSRSGFRFVLKKHIFVQPGGAYEWFAFRSKYTSGDLKSGKTLWWQKRKLYSDAYTKMKIAYNSVENRTGDVAICHAAVKRDLCRSFMLIENSPASAYNNELRRIYFLPVSSPPKYHSRGFYNSEANRLGRLKIDVPNIFNQIVKNPLPPRSSGSSALPPAVRHFYLPETVLQNLLPDFLQDILPTKNIESMQPLEKVNYISMPDDNKEIILWRKKGPRQRDSSCNFTDEGMIIHQIPEKDSDSSWKGSGIYPLTRNHQIPYLNSFFDKPLTGQIKDISIATANMDPEFPPVFSFIFSPSPAAASYMKWNDECLTLEFTWINTSNAVLKVFVKSYQLEDGLLYDNPGIKIGEENIITPIDIHIKIGSRKVDIFSKSSNTTNSIEKIISSVHDLSKFAWRKGVYFGVQTKACTSPVDYKVKDFNFGKEEE
ncbi:tetratricopeptide repeat protein [bacterium]|nr:tetratricopeptide repeat protein [bacterium]